MAKRNAKGKFVKKAAASNFRISDNHRAAPDKDHQTDYKGDELEAYKNLSRLIYAAEWGLDPDHVTVN